MKKNLPPPIVGNAFMCKCGSPLLMFGCNNENCSNYYKKKLAEHIHEGTVDVCAHHVSFYFRLPNEVSDDLKKQLNEEAESRAKSQIIEGYHAGELNFESEELSCTGWWKIKD